MSANTHQTELPSTTTSRFDYHDEAVGYRARCNVCSWQSYTTIEQYAEEAAERHRMRAQHSARVDGVGQ